jgi:hypothetical protein
MIVDVDTEYTQLPPDSTLSAALLLKVASLSHTENAFFQHASSSTETRQILSEWLTLSAQGAYDMRMRRMH